VLSPANGGPVPPPRELPTAEELSDVYGRHQLDRIAELAKQFEDTRVHTLAIEAIALQERRELLQLIRVDIIRHIRTEQDRARQQYEMNAIGPYRGLAGVSAALQYAGRV
jgi:hypothetical protein